MLLLAEIDRCAFKRFTKLNRPTYNPVIVCGDFNLEPYCSIYNLLSKGKLVYQGLSNKYLTRVDDGQPLGPQLIPPRLAITDECQHVAIKDHRLMDRTRSTQSGVVQFHTKPDDLEHLVRLRNSEWGYKYPYPDSDEDDRPQLTGIGDLLAQLRTSEEGTSNSSTPPPQLPAVDSSLQESTSAVPSLYSTGGVRHRLKLKSVYSHKLERLCGEPEVTTKQDDWVTVDYIFYR